MSFLTSGAVVYGCRHRTTRKRKPDDVDKMLEAALARVTSDALGPFWFQTSTIVRVADKKTVHVGLQQREKVELEELLRTGWIKEEFLREVLVPLNDESSAVPRLRMYNWAITNYAKGKAIMTEIQDKTGETRLIDPCASYNSTLKRLHRTLFDPYRREHYSSLKLRATERRRHITQLWGNSCLCGGAYKMVSTSMLPYTKPKFASTSMKLQRFEPTKEVGVLKS